MRRLFFLLLCCALLLSGTVYGQDIGNTIDFESKDQDLWIRAVINTEEMGPIEAVWRQGGQAVTERGDEVVWGLFYASPDDVTWGSRDNPDLYVKIWFDQGGRLDVNFFHVSVPDIEVYSTYPADGSIDQQGTTTLDVRYIRQYYENDQSFSEEQVEDGDPASGYFPANNPAAYSTINNLEIGASIITEEIGPADAVWQLGGTDTTAAGDQVVWGHFYASPDDVSWGSAANPDLFVKIWFDHGGRLDVNFFHVSVPDIEVYSDYPEYGAYDQKGTTIMSDRYIRHEYTAGGGGPQNYGLIIGTVQDLNGSSVDQVKVSVGSISETSNEQGYFFLENIPEAKDVLVKFEKERYVPTLEVTTVQTGMSSYLEAVMGVEGNTENIAASSGGTVSHDGGLVTISANTLKDAQGNVFTGTAEVSVTTFDPTTDAGRNAFPGEFEGVTSSGETIPILSYGFMDVTVQDDEGDLLQLAQGSNAAITIPIPADLQGGAPDTMPLWYFNTSDGQWHEEGILIRNGNVYEGTIGHFSIWNADVGYDRSWVSGYVVDCAGNPVQGARVTIKGISPRNCWDSGETSTPADGSFVRIPVDANSVCEIWASKGEAESEHVQFTSAATGDTYEWQPLLWGDDSSCDGPPLVTIILTWGEDPRDLDSHLTIPMGDDRWAHLYYLNDSSGDAALDTDDTRSYGPEVVTIYNLHDGVYRYSVHQFPWDTGGDLSSNGASVNMVIDGVGIYNLTPPAGASGDNDIWVLWDFTVQGGVVTNVSTVNTISVVNSYYPQ